MVVHFLNCSQIYHRDLKPENFLIKTELNGKVYLHLNDFGLAKNTSSDIKRLSTPSGVVKGSFEYLAPEILDSKFAKPSILK
jgi:serine/threonine protein kinase